MVIIGSTALKHWFPDFPREPKDLDKAVLGLSKTYVKEGIVTEELHNPVILKYQETGYLEPPLLLTLKISHLFWNINWDKHMWDVQFLLKKGISWDDTILKELILFWEDHLPKVRRSNLNLSKKDFFTNAVNKTFLEHDQIHLLLNPVPYYTLLLKKGAEVELDESLWETLSFEQKCGVVSEETMVMAWERYPNKDWRWAYTIQLNACIQTHFPKWIAIFAIQHYILLHKPQFNYFNLILEKQCLTKTQLVN